MVESLDIGRSVEANKERVFGIFLFVINEENEVLVFQNDHTKEKTQKIRGQLTLPAETIEPGESIADSTSRTIVEEVGSIKDPKPKFRGTIQLNTPLALIDLICLEMRVNSSEIIVNPQDKDELSLPQWVFLEDIDEREMIVGGMRVPLFRTPIPEFANNILKAGRGERFPLVQRVSSELPAQLFHPQR